MNIHLILQFVICLVAAWATIFIPRRLFRYEGEMFSFFDGDSQVVIFGAIAIDYYMAYYYASHYIGNTFPEGEALKECLIIYSIPDAFLVLGFVLPALFALISGRDSVDSTISSFVSGATRTATVQSYNVEGFEARVRGLCRVIVGGLPLITKWGTFAIVSLMFNMAPEKKGTADTGVSIDAHQNHLAENCFVLPNYQQFRC